MLLKELNEDIRAWVVKPTFMLKVKKQYQLFEYENPCSSYLTEI